MLSPLMLAAVLARGATARALAAAASAWVAVVAVLSELGYSGEERYLLPAAAAVAALAGIGAARGLRSRRVTAVALAAAVVATAPFSVIAARELVADVRDDAGLQHGLARAVAASGGADALRCGSIAAGRYRFPLVAWHLHSSIADVDFAARRGVVLRSRLRRNSPLEPPRPGARFNRVATAGGWEVWSTCA